MTRAIPSYIQQLQSLSVSDLVEVLTWLAYYRQTTKTGLPNLDLGFSQFFWPLMPLGKLHSSPLVSASLSVSQRNAQGGLLNQAAVAAYPWNELASMYVLGQLLVEKPAENGNMSLLMRRFTT
jgi:hypothetical protein